MGALLPSTSTAMVEPLTTNSTVAFPFSLGKLSLIVLLPALAVREFCSLFETRLSVSSTEFACSTEHPPRNKLLAKQRESSDFNQCRMFIFIAKCLF